MKLKEQFDIGKLMQAVGSCEGDVLFDTSEDHIDLSSTLSQYVFCTVIRDKKALREGEVRCLFPDDYQKLKPFAKAE